MDEHIRTDSDLAAAVRRDLGESAGVAIAPWHGIEQNLASVVLGSVFAIGGPPTALLIEFLQHNHFQGFGRVEVGAVGVAGGIGGVLVLAMSIFGLVFGVMGMGAARQQRRSIALGLAGVFLNGFDVLMWLFLLVCWILAVLGHR